MYTSTAKFQLYVPIHKVKVLPYLGEAEEKYMAHV
jgi:hypothetical protein